jgi:peptidoglycan/LPS O-acetylase OafA/YrhL
MSAITEVSGGEPLRTPGRFGADNANLDLLRSVAVLLVVAFHLELFLSDPQHVLRKPIDFWNMGHWGVLVFFVHTTYVLMLSLHRQMRDSVGRAPLFWAFITRRAFRLLPLSVLTVLVVTLLRWPVANWPLHAVPLRASSLLANVLLIQNLTHDESPVATLWSLPYEAQMYLVLPALFLFVQRARSVWPVVGLWLVSFVLCGLVVPHMMSIYEMPLYVPCFLAGIVGYQFFRSSFTQWSHHLWPVVIVMASIGYLGHVGVHTGWMCCLFIGICIPLFKQWPDGAFREVIRAIARYSYAIYLVHFVALWVAFVVVHGPRVVQWTTFIGLTAGVSYIAYHLVEAPMIRLGARLVHAAPARPQVAVTAGH